MAGALPDTGPLLIGGYFGTWHDPASVAGLPMAATALRQVGASPGAGVLVALPPDACGLAETARVLAWLAGQGAGQCGPCVFGLPATHPPSRSWPAGGRGGRCSSGSTGGC